MITKEEALQMADPREVREMLRAMQAGELTVSRGVELLDMWLAGNYSNDLLPPVRQDLIEEDSMPVEIIDRLRAENDRLKAERDDWKQKAIHWDGMYKYQRDCYDALRSEKEKLQAERDELVKTLKLVRQFTKEYSPQGYVVITIDAALAKIEGRG